MKNYAAIWKNIVNFRQISYEDFVTEFSDIKGTIFMEKVDGMLGAMIYTKGSDPVFQTTVGHLITDIPALMQYKEAMEAQDVEEAIIAGELVAKAGGKILPFNKSQSIVKRFKVINNKSLIHHMPYDIYRLNGRMMNINDALRFLKQTFKSGTENIQIPRISFGGIGRFRELYKTVHEDDGFDGVVARDIRGKNYKVKFTSTVDLVIIGAGKVGLPAWEKGQISYLLTSFIDKNGVFRSSSKIGTGFTERERKEWFEYIQAEKLYEENGEFFTKPKKVVELKYFRYRVTPTPMFKFLGDRYKFLGMGRSITFSHPTFVRERPDKRAIHNDVRLGQIPEWTP